MAERESDSRRSDSGPTIKERIQFLSALNDTAKLAEALEVAVTALAWYGDERHWSRHWSEHDRGVRAVVAPPDYGCGGQKARNAIKRIERLTRPERVAAALKEEPE